MICSFYKKSVLLNIVLVMEIIFLCSNNIKGTFGAAAVLAVANSIIFYMFSAGYSFGAFLVIERGYDYQAIFQ